MAFYWIIVVMFFFHGFSHSLVALVGFCINCDFTPETSHSMVGAAWNISEGIIYIYLTIYYRLISRNWVYPQILGLVITAAPAIVLAKWMPESPKWLYQKGRYEECCQALEKMAAFNGKELTSKDKLLAAGSKKDSEKEGDEKPKLSVKDEILASKTHMINLVCCIFVWVSASFGYYLIGY